MLHTCVVQPIYDTRTGKKLLDDLEVHPPFSRAGRRGLRGRDGLEDGAGVMIMDPLGIVNTFGMKFNIDIIFCNGAGQVMDVRENVPPRRIVVNLLAPRQVEMAAGQAKARGIQPGAYIQLIAE